MKSHHKASNVNTPAITMCDSIQTTDRKVTESSSRSRIETEKTKVLSNDSLLKYLNSAQVKEEKLKQNNTQWLKVEMEKFQEIMNQKEAKQHARRTSSCQENAALNYSSSEFSSIQTFIQKKSEPKKEPKKDADAAKVSCNFCSTVAFKEKVKESVKQSQLKAQTEIANKLVKENFKLKTALEKALNMLDASRAKQENLNQQVIQLRFESDNQAASREKKEREQVEIRSLLTVYEQLLQKMTEQNKKLKDWIKARKHRDKKRREKKQREGPEVTPRQVQHGQQPLDTFSQVTPQLSKSPNLNTGHFKILNSSSAQTYRELSVPKTLQVLDIKLAKVDLNKTQVKTKKLKDKSAYRPKTVQAFIFDDSAGKFEDKAGSTFGQANYYEPTPNPSQDGLTYRGNSSRSPSPHYQMQKLYQKVSQRDDFNQIREEYLTSITSLETSFRQLNLTPNPYF